MTNGPIGLSIRAVDPICFTHKESLKQPAAGVEIPLMELRTNLRPLTAACESRLGRVRATRRAKRQQVAIRSKSSRRLGGESGASMVEFALIALPFFVIIFGIIDFSLVIFDMHSANAGARASARFVGTGELESSTDCPMDFNNNFPAGVSNIQIENLKRVICMTKNRTHLSPDRIRVLIRFEETDNPIAASPSPRPGNSVVVCMMTRATSLTRLFSAILDNRSLKTTTRARLEGGQGFDYAKLTNGGEHPLPGSTWSECYKALSLPAGWTNNSPVPAP